MTLPLDFVSELRRNFRGDIRLDETSRILYSTDASIYQIEPLGIVIPRTQDDLIAAVELAAKYRVPILPRGSGSSLAGQAIGAALILDCSRYLDAIPLNGIDPEAQTAIVEPGVILANLNRAAAEYGLIFGPDPASAERATMGGVIGNNATGAHSILYGMTADHLVSADVILSDGSLAVWGMVNGRQTGTRGRNLEIINAANDIREKYAGAIKESWPRTWRNSAGYRLNYLLPWSASRPYQWSGNEYPPAAQNAPFNLASLLAGSEGTLAVIRSATVRLVPKPKNTILGVLAYDSIAAACDAVPGLLNHNPSAVELIPRMLIQLARSVPAYAGQLGFAAGDPAALLAIEFSGEDKTVLLEKTRALRSDVIIAESAAEQARVWGVRKFGLGIFDSRPLETRPIAFIEDCAIPVECLGDFVREVERILKDHGTYAAIYAHASAGCLHIRPILNLKQGAGVKALREISQEVLKLTLQLGGAMSSEHGDGLVRSEWLRQTYGEKVFQAMEQIKRAADPDSLLNPRNMTSAPSMDTNLRYGSDYRSRAWTPGLEFRHEGGLAGAIEQCNGQGVCRKHDGVMCPSFQATREEMHSTRGRANLLRALISIDRKSLPDEQVKQALDLCLACKGCKAECPSGVDMAKLKYEFQSHYFKNHRRPLRDYLFGYIGLFARLGASLGGVINWAAGRSFFQGQLSRLLGISEKRTFPAFRRLQNQSSTRHDGSGDQGREFEEECLFLPDTFTHYFEPDIEKAALDVLAACGVRVKILPVFGAGRTLLSKGFIEPARRHAARLLDEIQRADPGSKMAVVGLEPSEIYTLRDELMDLLPDRRGEVESLMARSWLIDEFLIRPARQGEKLRVARINVPQPTGQTHRILLHGHCYQKAQPPHPDGLAVGVDASAELLRSVGFDVETLNTGCCGMAGAFGYESEHFEVSMRVGELKLFPEIRTKSRTGLTTVAALGTSCRSQILDGTGIEANHSIVLVAQKLTTSL